jgi:hypothetical protein
MPIPFLETLGAFSVTSYSARDLIKPHLALLIEKLTFWLTKDRIVTLESSLKGLVHTFHKEIHPYSEALTTALVHQFEQALSD